MARARESDSRPSLTFLRERAHVMGVQHITSRSSESDNRANLAVIKT
jgi:hypothetical protein